MGALREKHITAAVAVAEEEARGQEEEYESLLT